MAPIEGKLRALVGDVVRNCQSILYERYQGIADEQTLLDLSRSSLASESKISANDNDPHYNVGRTRTRCTNSEFFVEPPHLSLGIQAECKELSKQTSGAGVQIEVSDSGYGSSSEQQIRPIMGSKSPELSYSPPNGLLQVPAHTISSQRSRDQAPVEEFMTSADWDLIDFGALEPPTEPVNDLDGSLFQAAPEYSKRGLNS